MIGNLHASLIFRQCGKGRPPDYRFVSVFVSYRYNAKVNFTEGRCPGSKAMNFDNAMTTATTVPNVTIADCDYTIAVWIRLLQPHAVPKIVGSSTSGKLLVLEISGRYIVSCRAVSTETLTHMTCVYVSSAGVVANNWTHIAVTCEQDNSVKIFFNGEIANNTQLTKSIFFTILLLLLGPPRHYCFLSILQVARLLYSPHCPFNGSL